jgi:hypothetical protein
MVPIPPYLTGRKRGPFVKIRIAGSSHYGPGCGFAALSGGTKSRFCGNNGLFSSVQSAQVGKFFQKSLKLELLQ